MTTLHIPLDPASPVPLYHQIAEAIRYRVATGAIAAGALLPPLREAAGTWGVNLHTVRRAYAELAAAAIVATRAPLGTQVLPPSGPGVPAADPLGRFLRRFMDEARSRHGLDAAGLKAAIDALDPDRSTPRERGAGWSVYVSECSESQAADLSGQVEERWRVTATPWPIDRPEPPPGVPVIATYFHYNDVRLHWPARFPAVRFLAIRPDPGLVRKLLRGRVKQERIEVRLCEREEPMLRNLAADLLPMLPENRFLLTRRLTKRPALCLRGVPPDMPVLVTPRLWGELPPAVRGDARVHEIRYLFDPAQLDSIGRELGWSSR